MGSGMAKQCASCRFTTGEGDGGPKRISDVLSARDEGNCRARGSKTSGCKAGADLRRQIQSFLARKEADQDSRKQRAVIIGLFGQEGPGSECWTFTFGPACRANDE